jgi:hypothetical protein
MFLPSAMPVQQAVAFATAPYWDTCVAPYYADSYTLKLMAKDTCYYLVAQPASRAILSVCQQRQFAAFLRQRLSASAAPPADKPSLVLPSPPWLTNNFTAGCASTAA